MEPPTATKADSVPFSLVLLKRYLGAARAQRVDKSAAATTEMVHLDSAKLDALDKAALDALSFDAPPDEERLFEWNWATALVSRAMAELSAEYSSGPKSRLLGELRPFLTGGVGLPTHQATAARLGVSMETLRSHLFRLRSRYRELLRAEVLRTVPLEADIDEELRYLCRILDGARLTIGAEVPPRKMHLPTQSKHPDVRAMWSSPAELGE